MHFSVIVTVVAIFALLVLLGNLLAPEKRGLLFGLRNFQITHIFGILNAIDQRILLFGGFNLCVASQIKAIEIFYYVALFESFDKSNLIAWICLSVISRVAFCSFG